MVQYLKNLIQLVLSPSKGWEDVSASLDDPELLLHKAYLPLLGIASLSEFIRLFYPNSHGFLTVIELAIAMFGSFFVAYYVARVILSHYLQSVTDGEINQSKVSIFVTYGLGLLLLIEILDNIMPAKLTLVKFLPLFVALILYKGSGYMNVVTGVELRFMCIAVAAILVVPIAIFALLQLIIY